MSNCDNGAPLGAFSWVAIQCMVGERKEWRPGGRWMLGEAGGGGVFSYSIVCPGNVS